MEHASHERNAAAIGAYKSARAVDADLLRRGLPIVRRLAFRLARRLPPSVEVDDLIGAGNEGLLKAIAAYQPTENARFEGYAERRIRGAMLDELRAMDPVTRHGRQRMRDVSRAIAELTQENGHPPGEAQVAERLGMDLESYRKLSGDLARAPALGHVGDAQPDDVVGQSPQPDARLLEGERKAQVAHAITLLPERTQQVLALYYQEECTQAEIGKILGVSEGRVCQILGEAAARIRAHLGVAAPAKRRRKPRRGERNTGRGR
ncbi:MAG: RNA polymerase sigma factor FliA [Myxococcota bacterium]